jgi:hypothetical protein
MGLSGRASLSWKRLEWLTGFRYPFGYELFKHIVFQMPQNIKSTFLEIISLLTSELTTVKLAHVEIGAKYYFNFLWLVLWQSMDGLKFEYFNDILKLF